MRKLTDDLIGKKFGRLTVLHYVEYVRGISPSSIWQCRCECGNFVKVRRSNLTFGHAKSCGCWSKEANFIHGMAKSPEYMSWTHMIQRCTNKKNNAYHNYGGRGITVCSRWRNSFKNFLADMGPRTSGHSLDRIDNNKGYSPKNCRWATRAQQKRNTRSNIYLTAFGRTQCVTDWSRECGIPVETLRARITAKYPIEKIFLKVYRIPWKPESCC